MTLPEVNFWKIIFFLLYIGSIASPHFFLIFSVINSSDPRVAVINHSSKIHHIAIYFFSLGPLAATSKSHRYLALNSSNIKSPIIRHFLFLFFSLGPLEATSNITAIDPSLAATSKYRHYLALNSGNFQLLRLIRLFFFFSLGPLAATLVLPLIIWLLMTKFLVVWVQSIH
jgi:hypothetical protein